MTPRWRLFPKYALVIVSLVGSMLLASGTIGIYFSWRENKNNLVALQVEKAEAAATRIEQYILDVEHQLGWTALPTVGVTGNPLEDRRIEYLKLLRQAPAITEVAWIDADGREQLRISRLAMDSLNSNVDVSAEPQFRVARGGGTYRGPVYFRKETEPYMTISRPAGSSGGVTVAEMNLKFVWEVVSRIRIGQQGLAYVVDAGGTLIAHPDISLVLKKTDLKALPQVAAAIGTSNLAQQQARGVDLQGGPVLTAHALIPTLRWTVFVESPQAEAFAPLYASIARALLVLGAGLLVAAIASFFVARALVRPLKALEEGAAQIGAGELDRRIDVRTGDELEGLAEQFNRMGAALNASYANLERKVDERTAELSETLRQQTATAEILRVISQSPNDVQPVFDVIADRSNRLMGGFSTAVWRLGDGVIRMVAYSSQASGDTTVSPMPTAMALSEYPMLDRVLAGATVQITDTEDPAQSSDAMRESARTRGFRSIVLCPLRRNDETIGLLTVTRRQPSRFQEHAVKLLQTFADQASIAIENVRLFTEIQEKSRQLELANKHKSEFLANMSHELRTPLNAIIGFSEVLAERMFGEVNDKQLEYLKDIHGSGHHLLSLINDILDLSKIEAGRMELDLATIGLPMLLDNCATLVRERASRQGLVLALAVEGGVGEWVLDVRKVKQVVINLLSNAVKFTPAGGKVTLRARRAGEAVEIAVVDTGIGIAPEHQALVFEEFRQAGGDYLRKAEGTGLGLALARRFVELHGGTIRVESVPGHGSTFAFILPLRTLEAI